MVRHGESAGNVARDAAEAGGLAMIDIAERDMDVPLSEGGESQARAVGNWFGEMNGAGPDVVLSSPYVRARRTAELLLEASGLDRAGVPLLVDERLREREFGILDRLTRVGITERYPEQSEIRSRVGKFYHRPPGGESWTDVGLRVRSVLTETREDFTGKRVLVVTHQVVLLMMRYAIERLTEEEILAVDRTEELANCSVSSYELEGERPVRRLWNFVLPVAAAGETVTAEPDAPVAPR
jgi:broad specificity phosphatase PhoE